MEQAAVKISLHGKYSDKAVSYSDKHTFLEVAPAIVYMYVFQAIHTVGHGSHVLEERHHPPICMSPKSEQTQQDSNALTSSTHPPTGSEKLDFSSQEQVPL